MRFIRAIVHLTILLVLLSVFFPQLGTTLVRLLTTSLDVLTDIVTNMRTTSMSF